MAPPRLSVVYARLADGPWDSRHHRTACVPGTGSGPYSSRYERRCHRTTTRPVRWDPHLCTGSITRSPGLPAPFVRRGDAEWLEASSLATRQVASAEAGCSIPVRLKTRRKIAIVD